MRASARANGGRLVTPDMHRVHHSRAEGDTSHNLATILAFWNRLFGTYREYPDAVTPDLVISLAEFDDAKHLRLDWMLAQPFLVASGNSRKTHAEGGRRWSTRGAALRGLSRRS